MSTSSSTRRTPLHFWIVGVVSVLWNAFGAFDYLATQLGLEFYMANFTEEQLAYFYGFPAWMDALWACGVWGAFVGSVLLLARSRWAVWAFGISLAGLAGSSFYTYVLSDGPSVMGETAAVMSTVIWVVAIALFGYAWWMRRRAVLR